MSQSQPTLRIAIDSRTAEQRANSMRDVLEQLDAIGARVSQTTRDTINQNLPRNAAQATTAINTTTRATTELGSSMARTQNIVRMQQQAVHDLTRGVITYSDLTRQSAQANSDFGASLSGLTTRIFGAISAYAAFKELLATTDEYRKMEGQIRLVTDSQQQLDAVMQKLTASAQATGTELGASVDLYTKMKNSSDSLTGASDDVLLRLTDIVNKFVTIGGSSGASAAQGLFQFSQAMGSGVLRGEEFNSVLEQTPGLAKGLRDGLGLTLGELRKMAFEGKLTSDIIINALLKMGNTADKQYGKIEKSSSQAFEVLKREIKEMVNEIDSGLGATDAFIANVNGVSSAIHGISAKTQAGEISLLTGAIAVLSGVALRQLIVSAKAATIALHEKIIKTQAAVVADKIAAEAAANAAARVAHLTAAELANAEAQLVRLSGMQRVAYMERVVLPLREANRAAIERDTAAQLANNQAKSVATSVGRGLLAVMGGPMGLAITAVSVAGGIWAAKAATDAMKDSTDDLTKSLIEAANGFRQMSYAQQQQKLVEAAEKNRKNIDELKDLQNKFLNDLTSMSTDFGGGSAQAQAISSIIKQLVSKQINYGQALKQVTAIDLQNNPFATNRLRQLIDYAAQIDKTADSTRKQSKATLDLVAAHDKLSKEIKNGVAQVGLKNPNAKGDEEAAKILDKLKEGYANDKDPTVFGRISRELDELAKKTPITESLRKQILEQAKAWDGLNAQQKESLKVSKDLAKLAKLDLPAGDRKAVKQNADGSYYIDVDKRTQAYAKQHDFAGIESRYGLPSGLLAAQASAESGGNAQAVSGAGAKGLFQFMDGTAKQYKVDVNDVRSSAEGAAKYMKYLFDMFGDWTKAIAAYNAGEGTIQKGRMPAETRQYQNRVMLRMGGMTASQLGDQSNTTASEVIKEAEAEQQKRLAIVRDYGQKREVAEQEYQQALIALNQSGIDQNGDQYQRYLSEIEREHKATLAKIEIEDRQRIGVYEDMRRDALARTTTDQQQALDLQKQILERSYAERIALVHTHVDMTDAEQKRAVELLNQTLDVERAAIKKSFDDRAADMRASFDSSYQSALEYARRIADLQSSGLSPDMVQMGSDVAGVDLKRKQLAERRPIEQLGAELNGMSDMDKLRDDYNQRQLLIEEALAKRQITEDEAHAYSLEAEKAYERAKRDIAINNAQDIAGSLTDITKSLMGEQSKAYQVMFAVEKGIAIARSVMAIQTGLAMAAANPFPYNLAAIATVAAETASIISNIQAVRLAGQAHDGIDYVPAEGTWNLQKGERVLSPRQNADLNDYMKRDKPSGITVNIENHGTSKQFDVQQIDENTVRVIARDEVSKGAGRVVAGEMANPNSPVSKAMSRNLNVERNRS